MSFKVNSPADPHQAVPRPLWIDVDLGEALETPQVAAQSPRGVLGGILCKTSGTVHSEFYATNDLLCFEGLWSVGHYELSTKG